MHRPSTPPPGCCTAQARLLPAAHRRARPSVRPPQHSTHTAQPSHQATHTPQRHPAALHPAHRRDPVRRPCSRLIKSNSSPLSRAPGVDTCAKKVTLENGEAGAPVACQAACRGHARGNNQPTLPRPPTGTAVLPLADAAGPHRRGTPAQRTCSPSSSSSSSSSSPSKNSSSGSSTSSKSSSPSSSTPAAGAGAAAPACCSPKKLQKRWEGRGEREWAGIGRHGLPGCGVSFGIAAVGTTASRSAGGGKGRKQRAQAAAAAAVGIGGSTAAADQTRLPG